MEASQLALRYRLSFIINTSLGGVMLVLAAVAGILEYRYPSMLGSLALGFLIPALICLAIGVAHRRKYHTLINRED